MNPLDSGIVAESRQFHITSCLGRGGFGEVYRATMVSSGGLRTEVAVKVLHAEVDPKSQAVQRLRDEGRMLGAVRHPSVLTLYDLVVLDGRVALVTEYVEGQDLDKALVGDEPIPLRAMIEVVGRLSDALRAAYEAPGPTGTGRLELVHRDIKPANIRLGRHGEVKLLDFGIARATNVEREARTETNAMLGSYLYMAPERFLENTDSGPAVDVYALGVTLFEGLHRRRLFGELTLKDVYLLILEQEKYDAFIRQQLEVVSRDVPHQVVHLLHQMVALDPHTRPTHEALSKACLELSDRLGGKTLERWARSRVWPTPKAVRGMLDGSVITAGTAGSARIHGESQHPTPGSLSRASPHARPDDAGVDMLRTVTATLERPGVVVGVGVGLFGFVGVILLGGLGLLAVAGVIWWQSADPPTDPVAVVGPEEQVPAPVPEVVAPVPEVQPGTPDPRPRTKRPVAPPAPEPVAEPARPDPRPAPAAAKSKLTVEGGVLVEFVGKAGTFRAGLVPPGTYEIRAMFPESNVPGGAPQGLVRVEASETATIRCSKLEQRCKVQP